jgi:hypothetical protein
MKKTMLAFIILALPGYMAAALPNFYITLGVTNPMAPEDIKANYLPGTLLGLMIGKPLNSRLELAGDLSLHLCTFDRKNFTGALEEEPGLVTGDNATFLSAMIKAKLFMGSMNNEKSGSYFFAGTGLLYSKTGAIQGLAKEDLYIPAKTRLAAGAALGLGVEIHMESTIFLIETGAIMGFTEGGTTVLIPLRLGLALKPKVL